MRARALGLPVFTMPLFEIGPLAWQAPDPNRFDALLLTSANAARHAGGELAGLRPLPVIAVGANTAQAAREHGLTVAHEGSGGVEALLVHVPRGLRLLHLAGRHRTEPESFSHSIDVVPVYEAVPRATAGDLARVEGTVIALHSGRAAAQLAELTAAARINRSAIALVTLSPAVAAAAGKGWECIETAGTPSDAALLALAAALCL
ncbi:MAG: uroporphyrinogen-III synthase [Sphingomicrobium sp.]|nr:uroporphyrinogen-III synthase [Sphingomonadales bacterium]